MEWGVSAWQEEEPEGAEKLPQGEEGFVSLGVLDMATTAAFMHVLHHIKK